MKGNINGRSFIFFDRCKSGVLAGAGVVLPSSPYLDHVELDTPITKAVSLVTTVGKTVNVLTPIKPSIDVDTEVF
jgi:hypothetical protein